MADKRKIAFFSIKDFANIFTHWARSVDQFAGGFEARSICVEPHPIDYRHKHDYDLGIAQQSVVDEALQYIKDAEFLVVAEESGISSLGKLRTLDKLKKLGGRGFLASTTAYKQKNMALYHSGSCYRERAARFNRFRFAQTAISTHLYGYDLYRLGPQDDKSAVVAPACFGPIANNLSKQELKDRWANAELLKCFHAPSNRKKKGTVRIIEIFERLKKEFPNIELSIPERPLNQKELGEQRRRSHFYIDQYIPEIGGFGVSSMEAIADGCVTFASLNNVTQGTLICATKYFGDPILPFINLGQNKEECLQAFRMMFRQSPEQLADIGWRSYEYHLNNFSPEPVAKQLCSVLTRSAIS